MPPFYIEPADADDDEMADIDQAITFFTRTTMALPSRVMRQRLGIIPASPMLNVMHHLFAAVWAGKIFPWRGVLSGPCFAIQVCVAIRVHKYKKGFHFFLAWLSTKLRGNQGYFLSSPDRRCRRQWDSKRVIDLNPVMKTQIQSMPMQMVYHHYGTLVSGETLCHTLYNTQFIKCQQELVMSAWHTFLWS